MKKLHLFLLLTVTFTKGFSQTNKIFTDDIDRFWIAYDSLKTIQDSTQKVEVFRSIYVENGSEGLHAFMKERYFPPERMVALIEQYPKFWNSIRPRTFLVKTKKQEMEAAIEQLRHWYPELKEAKMYFTIGGLASGGTTQKDKVLIGTEIATGNKEVDVSEFENDWLATIFAHNDDNQLVTLNIHEYVHTQQRLENENGTLLLGNAILEGTCDFVSMLITNATTLPAHLDYYRKHELEIMPIFYSEMFGKARSNWIGSGGNINVPMADLGYAIGHEICKFYFDKASDKRLAIKQMIELDYRDSVATVRFLEQSGYLDYLKAKGFVPQKNENIEGVKQTNEKVYFLFDTSKQVVCYGENQRKIFDSKNKNDIKTVSIAGEFNDWQTQHIDFGLTKLNENLYELAIDKKLIGKKGERKYFKFVINGSYWVEPSFYATNKGSNDGNSTNLFVKVE